MEMNIRIYSFVDALLADLQNTRTNLNHSSTGHQSSSTMIEDYPLHSQSSNADGQKAYYTEKSPIYQNQQMIQEITMATPVSQHQQFSPKLETTLESNLTELDTLLEDLNTARFMTYPEMKDSYNQPTVNDSCSFSPASPKYHTVSSPVNTIQDVSTIQDVECSVPDTVQKSKHPSQSVQLQTVAALSSPSSADYYSSSPVPMASSATKELDDLMASLSDFKLKDTTQAEEEPAYTKAQKPLKQLSTPAPDRNNQLDSMLGTLQCDMNKQGVNTTAKGHCTACNKPIVGQVVTALGRTWHPEHFTCKHCNEELGTKNFFERDGDPYCEMDYHNIFSPRCAYCNGPILDKCVMALDKTWHPEHFFCTQCGQQFDEDGFHERDGKPYCHEDYYELFAPKCGGCNRPITENYISALNNQWHPGCFVCWDCRQPFNGGSFYDHEGQPYCEIHYHAKRGSLCAGCHKPISGRCITAMFRKFHPEHFVCSFCLKQLSKGTFKEQNDKPYCHACFEKLFG
ncbi:leupaxin-like isoform X2 [Tachypleus tridentatus]|uniref:leupaxin-like isoform X2 n=1 Tax=Tachypleus tridentatus TaxID=6853 RepID=UPI003FD6B05C